MRITERMPAGKMHVSIQVGSAKRLFAVDHLNRHRFIRIPEDYI